ncbi:MAG: M6 family metalloprotease domain-containing protein [Bacteroidales bacterium]|nr:M6 family metalloprotease domain-containing protein [Bacteroidales bacterium]
MTITQPDGTSFQARLVGDEFSHVMLTTSGNAVIQGEDGFYYYAVFEPDGSRKATSTKVGSVAPSSVLSASADVPYDLLRAHVKEIKSGVSLPEESIFKRIEQFKGPRTKGETRQKHGLVILVQFASGADSYKGKFRYTRDNFAKMLTQSGYNVNGAVGCAKEYFDAQFNGSYEFIFDVTDIVTVSKDRKDYGGNDYSGSDIAPELMIEEACRLVDDKVDFSKYDDDGDGEVDNVFVFYAGGDEAEGVGDDYIWAHAWYIKDGAGKTLVLDGKVINRYACASELITFNAGKTFSMAPIGTFCHEYSHTFGLPDLYDTDYDGSSGTSDATWGSLTLMDSGNNNGNGNIPPYYSAIEREYLGIAQAQALPSGNARLEAIHKNNEFYRMESDKDGEYFLFECREKTGWDSAIGGEGLLVYHIDMSDNDAGRSETYRIGLSAAKRWVYNEVNSYPAHQCVDIIECNPNATGTAATRHFRGNYVVEDIFFPYKSYNSITDIAFWSGKKADISITGISYENGTVQMSIIGSAVTPPKVKDLSISKFQDGAIINFNSSFSYDGEATVSYGPTGKQAKTIKLHPYKVSSYAIAIDGLSPSTPYTVTVNFTLDSIQGESETKSFMTDSFHEGFYPHIHLKGIQKNNDGTYPSGSAFPLRIYDATDIDGIMWYYNEQPAKVDPDCWFRPAASGELKAEIFHTNGSKEIIVKQIKIR